jgi:sucrose-6-phosphate hydrolase SacC (GH32 family)
MASDPKVFWDEQQGVWVMFYFGAGDGTHGHADIMIAFSKDLVAW